MPWNEKSQSSYVWSWIFTVVCFWLALFLGSVVFLVFFIMMLGTALYGRALKESMEISEKQDKERR